MPSSVPGSPATGSELAGTDEGSAHDLRIVRGRADASLSQGLLGSLGVAVYTTDADGRLVFYNDAAAALWGYRPKLGEQKWCGSLRLFWPHGREMPHDHCPLAVALREGRDLHAVEVMAERPDGTRVSFLTYPSVLRDESGALTGATNALVDIGRYKRSEAQAHRLAAIVTSSRDAIVSKDLNGIIQSWNEGAERIFGYTAEEAIGQSVTMLIPPDHQDEEPQILARIRRGEQIDPYHTVRRRKDGVLVNVSLSVSPILDSEGRIIGASKIARDVTDEVRARERQILLLREMNHRVKNVFALAGGLVSLCSRVSRTPADLAATVREKLGALSRAHELTLPSLADECEDRCRTTDLKSLLEIVTSPFLVDPSDSGEPRIRFDGPFVKVNGTSMTSIALLMHELATNAAKYGALSSHVGAIELGWAIDGDRLRLVWVEKGGPEVSEPEGNEGFGSLLTRGTLEHQLRGEMSREWNPEGLIVRMSIPLASLA